MAPKTDHQIREIKASRKKQILDVACTLFANRGFYETTISSIAKEAGISKGLIYNYFESKESILKTLLVQGMEKMYEGFDRNHDGVLTRDELFYYISTFFDTITKNREFWKLYFAILVQPSVMELGTLKKDLFALETPFILTIRDFFVKNNYPDPDLEVEFLYALFSGFIFNNIFDFGMERAEKFKGKIFSLYPNPQNKNHE